MAWLIYIAVSAVIGVLLGRYAESKGYGYWNWFFPSSLLGIIWILVVPNLKKDTTMSDDLKASRAKGTNTAGIVLAILGHLLSIFQLLSLSSVQ